VPGQSEKWDDVIRQLTSVWTPESAARVLAAIAQLDLQGSSSEGDVLTRVGDKFVPQVPSGQVVGDLLVLASDLPTTDPQVWRALYRTGAAVQLSRGPVLVLHTADGSDPDLYFAGPLGATVTVDWGDGTTDEVLLTGVDADLGSGEVEATHTYTDSVTNHVITITVQEGVTLDAFEAHVDSAAQPAPNAVPWLAGVRTLDYYGFGSPFPDLSAVAATVQSLGFRNSDLTATPDLSTFPVLRRLRLDHTGIMVAPDLSACAAVLETLNMSSTTLTAIDLTGLRTLQVLLVSSLFLTEIDLSDCMVLQLVDVSSSGGSSLSTLDLSPCPLLDSFYANSHASLTSITTAGCVVLRRLYAIGTALSEAVVNALLANAVLVEAAAPGQGGSLDLSGGTSAPPSGQGATDAATLISAGWTVLVN
jgi:hypothetical protein